MNEACRSWRKPTLLLFGQNDPFIPIKSIFDFLEDKRTNFELAELSTRVSDNLTKLVTAVSACAIKLIWLAALIPYQAMKKAPTSAAVSVISSPRHASQHAALQMGHMPQEDYAEAIQKTISNFLKGIKE